jgi:uncharacterized CHY-type Zn-finger protein
MSFSKKSLRNILAGAITGAIILNVLSAGFLLIAKNAEIAPGLGERFVKITFAGFVFGGMMGFFFTKPAKKNTAVSVLMVVLAVVSSIIMGFIFVRFMNPETKLADAAALVLLCIAPVFGILCAVQQFSKNPSQKAAGGEVPQAADSSPAAEPEEDSRLSENCILCGKCIEYNSKPGINENSDIVGLRCNQCGSVFCLDHKKELRFSFFRGYQANCPNCGNPLNKNTLIWND